MKNWVSAFGMALMVALPQATHAENLTPPPMPDQLQVLAPNELFLVGHAIGTQNYVCLPSGSGFAWSLFTPEATLFKDLALERQVVTHFFSPNPDENGLPIRATWQDSRDSSIFWGAATAVATFATDPNFVAPDAIAWVKLGRAGVQDGLGGGDNLSKATFVQRLNTTGGLAPSTDCALPADVGNKAFVPYTADYLFYFDPTATVDQRD
jgi:Protein of unknown function (DUF3455)